MYNKITSIIFLIIVLMFACHGESHKWIINDQQIIKAPEKMALSPQLLKNNIETTEFTALIIIKKVKVVDDSKSYGYVNYLYSAKVLQVFKGQNLDEITYSVMADADIKPYMPAYPIIVSLCSSKIGFYVPDNGYVSPAPDSLLIHARKFAKGSKVGYQSVCN